MCWHLFLNIVTIRVGDVLVKLGWSNQTQCTSMWLKKFHFYPPPRPWKYNLKYIATFEMAILIDPHHILKNWILLVHCKWIPFLKEPLCRPLQSRPTKCVQVSLGILVYQDIWNVVSVDIGNIGFKTWVYPTIFHFGDIGRIQNYTF